MWHKRLKHYIIIFDTTRNPKLHYENSSIQIFRKFHLEKQNFQLKNADIFHISAQNIDCGYSLEPPQQGSSNKYP